MNIHSWRKSRSTRQAHVGKWILLLILSTLLIFAVAACSTDEGNQLVDIKSPEPSIAIGSTAQPIETAQPSDHEPAAMPDESPIPSVQGTTEPVVSVSPSVGGLEASPSQSPGQESPQPVPSPTPAITTESPTPTAETPAPTPGKTTSPTPSVEPSLEPSDGDDSEIAQEDAITVKVVGPNDLLLFETALDPLDLVSAFDALKAACEAEGVTLKYNGTGSFIYVKSIGNYAERSEGPLSGWIFKVNGETPSKSCNAVKVAKGDRVNFYFSLDLGKDVADKD